jgi:hypothetical protein
VLPSPPEALKVRREAVTETVLEEEDGLGILMLRLSPGGQSMLVAAGAIRHGGALLERLSALFVSPDEPAYIAEAGPEGGELLVLQYPRRE